MNEATTGMNKLPPDVDLLLDRLLDDWSEHLWNEINLHDAIPAEDVIVHAEDLGYAWWSDLFAHLPYHPGKAG